MIGKAFKAASTGEKRRVINEAMVKKRDGSYELNLKSRALAIVVDRERMQRGGTEARGVCKQQARTMCGGDAGLLEAIAEGNVVKQENPDTGLVEYIFSNSIAQDLTAVRVNTRAEGQGNLSVAQHRCLLYIHYAPTHAFPKRNH